MLRQRTILAFSSAARVRFLLLLLAATTMSLGSRALSSSSNSKNALSSRPGTVLVTGSTDGIGVTTSKNLAQLGYHVLIHGRDAERIAQAKDTVSKYLQNNTPVSSSDAEITTLPPVDLSTIEGSRQLARHVQEALIGKNNNGGLAVLMNNAGVFAEDRIITEDNLELTFAVNVVAPFVLTSLLLPTLLKNPNSSRIVIASSISQCRSIRDWNDLTYQKRPFSSHAAYSESKLLDAMLTMEMADRLERQFGGSSDRRITCNCLDPGTVNTKMLLAGWGRIGIDVKDALDQSWLCSSPDVEGVTGKYFVSRSDRRASSDAYDPRERARLWSLLSQLAPDAAEMWDFHWLQK